MKIERKQEDFRIRNVKRIKRSRFPMSLFAIYLGVVLLMAGVHTGILVVAYRVPGGPKPVHLDGLPL